MTHASELGLSSIPLTVLRYVSAAAEHGSFSQAARTCEVTQPTVSNAIAGLEERLGGPIFARTTRRLTLTAFGEHLMPFIADVVARAEELLAEADRFHNPPQKLIRVGFSPLFSSQLLFRLLEPFRTQCPDVDIIYKECNVGDMESRLDAHTIDFLLTPYIAKSSRRRTLPVFSEPLYFLPRGGVPPEMALKRRAGINLEAIAEQLLVFTKGDCGLAPATRELFTSAKLRVQEYRGEALSYSVLQEWAELGIGAAIMPGSRIEGDETRFPPVMSDERPVEITFRAAWNRDAVSRPHIEAFVRYLRMTVPKLVSGQDLRTVG